MTFPFESTMNNLNGYLFNNITEVSNYCMKETARFDIRSKIYWNIGAVIINSSVVNEQLRKYLENKLIYDK